MIPKHQDEAFVFLDLFHDQAGVLQFSKNPIKRLRNVSFLFELELSGHDDQRMTLAASSIAKLDQARAAPPLIEVVEQKEMKEESPDLINNIPKFEVSAILDRKLDDSTGSFIYLVSFSDNQKKEWVNQRKGRVSRGNQRR